MSAPAQSPAPAIRYGGVTNIGRCRENNEDSYRCDPLGQGVLLIVSDGVGGANAGEVASRMAVDGLYAELLARAGKQQAPEDRQPWLKEAILSVDRRVKEASAKPGQQGMGATVSMLWIDGSVAWWGQAGDSRIYLYRNGTLQQITRDHSPVGRLRAEGQLTEEAARKHPYRHLIDECLGGDGPSVRPDTGTLKLEEGDAFLLCSDGLSDGLWDREIAERLARATQGIPVDKVALDLVDGANAASGRDNITAIVAHVSRLMDGKEAESQAPDAEGGKGRWLDSLLRKLGKS